MQLSLLLMKEIAQLFAMLIMGYILVKAGLIKNNESKSISVISVYLVMPCVIINAFQVEATPEVQQGLIWAFIAAGAAHVIFLVANMIFRPIFKLDVIERASLIYPNAAMLVIPLVKNLLGQQYVIYSSAFVIIQTILLWTQCKNMLCGEEKIEWKKVLLNINIISIIIGLLLFILKIELPEPVTSVMSSMSDMVGPLGMLLAGMVIAEAPLSAVFGKKRNYLTVVLRLFVYPVLALLVLKIILPFVTLEDSKNILLTVYLACITPACATITTMAQLYDRDAPHASAIYVLTTTLAIITMPIMTSLFLAVMGM